MEEDIVLNAVLAEIRVLGTRIDNLGTRVTALEPTTQVGQDVPEDQAGVVDHDLRGPRARGARGLRGNRRVREWPESGTDSEIEEELPPPPQRRMGARRRGDRDDPSVQSRHPPRVQGPSLKLSAPTFEGKVDPEAYLDWERRMDHIFGVYDYDEARMIQFAAAQLVGHALTWWDREQQTRRRNREGQISSWELMKFAMRRRYVPPMYHRELQKKFRRLTQGSKSVEEYYEEFEHLRNRLELDDDEETLMAQFLDGLQERIVRKVERQSYAGFEELLHLAIQVESQVKRKSASMSRMRPTAPPPAPWAPRTPAQPSSSRPMDKGKGPAVDPRFRGNPTAPVKDTREQVRRDFVPQRSRDIECFKCRGKGHYARDCPNQRVMVLTPSGEIESQDEVDEPQEEDSDDQADLEITYPEPGEILVTRRVLSSAPVLDEEIAQRENIFHTRCTVSGKVCGIIVDGGSCTNVASTYLVDKLNLPLIKHPKPYRLRWLNDKTELHVVDQVRIAFTIGKYSDEVLCDVVPMQASHLLLGRPWQFDREAIHNGRTNQYTIVHDKKKFILAPLLPLQVHELQVAMSKNKVAAKSNFLINFSDVRKTMRDDSLPVVLMIF